MDSSLHVVAYGLESTLGRMALEDGHQVCQRSQTRNAPPVAARSRCDRHWVDAQEAHLASISQKDAATVDDVDCGPDDLTCAICLCQPEPVDLAIIKGCEHNYCGEAWA